MMILTYRCPRFLLSKCNYSVGSSQELGHLSEVKVRELVLGVLREEVVHGS